MSCQPFFYKEDGLCYGRFLFIMEVVCVTLCHQKKKKKKKKFLNNFKDYDLFEFL